MKPSVKKWIFWGILASSLFTIFLSVRNTYLLSKISRYPKDYTNEIIKYEFKSRPLKRKLPLENSLELTDKVFEKEQTLCLGGENKNFFITLKNKKYLIAQLENSGLRVTGSLIKLEEGFYEVEGSSLILRASLRGKKTEKLLEVLVLQEGGESIRLANYYGQHLLSDSCLKSEVYKASSYWKPL